MGHVLALVHPLQATATPATVLLEARGTPGLSPSGARRGPPEGTAPGREACALPPRCHLGQAPVFPELARAAAATGPPARATDALWPRVSGPAAQA